MIYHHKIIASKKLRLFGIKISQVAVGGMLLSLLLLTGCSFTSGFVAVEKKFGEGHVASGYHRVTKGETLYSIAWRYGIDFRDLARANSIASPYTIYPNQKIIITNTVAGSKVARSSYVEKPSVQPSVGQKEPSTPIVVVPAPPKSTTKAPVSTWTWPANGRLIAKFSSKPPINKGVDIEGALGESVNAAMAGTVVYAGQGLRGYGNLVIIKHNETYLSAYAHAQRILVSEQQNVKAGEKIAEIGSTGTDKNKLHFEIRQNGQPVDPLHYLPKR